MQACLDCEKAAEGPKAINPIYCKSKRVDSPTKDVDEARQDVDEARRNLKGVPKSSWNKMTDAEKAEAVEKAKAAKSKASPSM